MTEEVIDKIERYLNGEMSAAELSVFENELKNNSELQQQVEFMRLLPGAIEAHSDEQLRKQLKDFEATLPKIEKNQDNKIYRIEDDSEILAAEPISEFNNKDGRAAANLRDPKSISFPYWAKMALAASVLLLVGLFIFKDMLFKSGIEGNQIAGNTIKPIIQSKSIKTIGDSGFGFAADSSEVKIWIVQISDTTLLNNYIAEQLQGRAGTPAGDGLMDNSIAGLYYFNGDSLFIISEKVDSAVELYDINVAAQKSNNIETPELRGMYLHFKGMYYKLEMVNKHTPLIPVKNEDVLSVIKKDIKDE